MKLVVTADLHYNIARSKEPTRKIAEEICGLRADVLLVLGDIGGRDLSIVSDCLHLFDQFTGSKLFVAGNHDLWCFPGGNSLERLEKILPGLCREAGFHPLDIEPTSINGFGFVGSIGWYDFGYRPDWLNIPLRFYEAKIAPGAALQMKQYQDLVTDISDVSEAALRINSRWMDGEHIHLPMSDLDLCHRLLRRFVDHLETAARQSDTIIVGLHHIPFRELVPLKDDPKWAFANAFMGSGLFGEAMLSQPKIRYAFCGHSHRTISARCGHIDCIDVGCTYTAKRYELIEL